MTTNDERDRQLYKYPDSDVLRNKLGILDAKALEHAERLLVQQRIVEGAPSGKFDLDHLKAIHKHLFQDVYAWAGEIRQTNIAKGQWFHPHNRIETGMADVQARLAKENFLRRLDADQFARRAAEYIGDVNRCHPFREGNGRTQLQYLKQLGAQAGLEIDLSRFTRQTWIAASIASHGFDDKPMEACIGSAIRERSAKIEEWRQARQHSKSRDRGMGDD